MFLCKGMALCSDIPYVQMHCTASESTSVTTRWFIGGISNAGYDVR